MSETESRWFEGPMLTQAEVTTEALRVLAFHHGENMAGTCNCRSCAEQRGILSIVSQRDTAIRERDEARETRDFFANRLNEALGALGYEVPGDTPQGRYRCGLCGPKDAALLDADHEWALWREKWTATVDVLGNASERAEKAESRCERLEMGLRLARRKFEEGNDEAVWDVIQETLKACAQPK